MAQYLNRPPLPGERAAGYYDEEGNWRTLVVGPRAPAAPATPPVGQPITPKRTRLLPQEVEGAFGGSIRPGTTGLLAEPPVQATPGAPLPYWQRSPEGQQYVRSTEHAKTKAFTILRANWRMVGGQAVVDISRPGLSPQAQEQAAQVAAAKAATVLTPEDTQLAAQIDDDYRRTPDEKKADVLRNMQQRAAGDPAFAKAFGASQAARMAGWGGVPTTGAERAEAQFTARQRWDQYVQKREAEQRAATDEQKAAMHTRNVMQFKPEKYNLTGEPANRIRELQASLSRNGMTPLEAWGMLKTIAGPLMSDEFSEQEKEKARQAKAAQRKEEAEKRSERRVGRTAKIAGLRMDMQAADEKRKEAQTLLNRGLALHRKGPLLPFEEEELADLDARGGQIRADLDRAKKEYDTYWDMLRKLYTEEEADVEAPGTTAAPPAGAVTPPAAAPSVPGGAPPPAEVPAPTFRQATMEPVRVNTPDEARRLAPGTRFVTPDGRTGTR